LGNTGKIRVYPIVQVSSPMASSPSPEAGRAADAPVPADDSAAAGHPDRFESALSELEGIVQQMEGGALSLEQSLAAYRRVAELVGVARKALADVEQQVRILEADVLKPFDAGQADEG